MSRRRREEDYRCEATSLRGFIKQLAVQYVTHGYWFYVSGTIPEKKDPRAVDRKLIHRYHIAVSASERCRRKKAGTANLQYLRHGRFFVLLATHGRHLFFEDHAETFRDIREVAVKHGGYSVSYRNGHASVGIERSEYNRLKAYFEDRAVQRSPAWLSEELARLDYEPYAPVRRQLLCIFRAVNEARQAAGLSRLTGTPFRFAPRPCKPFEPTLLAVAA